MADMSEPDIDKFSSTSSSWVPVFPQAIQASIANRRPTPPPKPQPPPKPPKPSMVSRNSMTSSPGAGGNNSIRHSVVSQNSNTGRVEITLVEDEPPHYNINGDSGKNTLLRSQILIIKMISNYYLQKISLHKWKGYGND